MSTAEGIKHENNEWVARRFAGDVAALSAAAERGDAKAQLAMVIRLAVAAIHQDSGRTSHLSNGMIM